MNIDFPKLLEVGTLRNASFRGSTVCDEIDVRRSWFDVSNFRTILAWLTFAESNDIISYRSNACRPLSDSDDTIQLGLGRCPGWTAAFDWAEPQLNEWSGILPWKEIWSMIRQFQQQPMAQFQFRGSEAYVKKHQSSIRRQLSPLQGKECRRCFKRLTSNYWLLADAEPTSNSVGPGARWRVVIMKFIMVKKSSLSFALCRETKILHHLTAPRPRLCLRWWQGP